MALIRHKGEKRFVLTVTVSILLFMTIIGFIMSIFYRTISDTLVLVGKETTVSSVSSVQLFIREVIDIVEIESESIDYMLESENSEIKKYLTLSTNGYAAGIDEEFTGFYGLFNGEYLDGTDWIPDEDYIPEERPWYITALNAGNKTTVSSPYLDAQTGKIMISVVKLLSDNKSVLAADISLDPIDELVADICRDGTTNCVILDSEGLAVSSSLNDKGMNYKSGEAGPDKQQLLQKIYSNDSAYFYEQIDTTTYLVFSGEIFEGWRSVILMNRNDIYSETFRNITVSVVISLLLMMLLLYLCFESNKKRYEAERRLSQMKAISSIYVSLGEINIKQNSFEEILRLSSFDRFFEQGGKDAKLILESIVNNLVDENYIESMLSFIDFKTLPQRLSARNTITCEFKGRALGWCRTRFIVVNRNKNNIPERVLLAVENINEAKLQEQKLVSESTTDKLTGCLNRKAYEDKINFYTENPLEQNLIYVSVDVNGLKNVNDSLGHAAGDELIKATAECMKKIFTPYGDVYRTGGDEFFAVIHADTAEIQTLIAGLKEEASSWKGEYVNTVALSAGYASASENPELTIHEIAKHADKMMYNDKSLYYRKQGVDRRGNSEAFRVLSETYTKILRVNLTDDTFQSLSMDENERISEKGYRDNISSWLKEFALSGQVHEDDREEYLRMTDIEYLRRYFAEGNQIFSIRYRRRYDNGFSNVMMEIILSPEYSSEKAIVYLYVKQI